MSLSPFLPHAPRPLRKRLKNWIIYQSVRGFVAFVNGAPRRVALETCDLLGRCAYFCAPGTRRRTLANLRRAFGGTYDETAIRAMAVRVFRHIGRNAVDAARLSRLTPENVDALVEARGMAYLQDAYEEGRGVIAVSGHLGNFELLGAYLALKGYPMTVVAAALYDPRLDALLWRNRRDSGLRVTPRDRATRAALQALRRGEVVGLLIDQDTRVHGVFVDFFGCPAYTPAGPAILASRTGAPVVPMAIQRQSDDTHLITIRPPLPAPDRSDESVQAATRRYAAEIEAFIRQTPTQWVWMHDRWKTQPEDAG